MARVSVVTCHHRRVYPRWLTLVALALALALVPAGCASQDDENSRPDQAAADDPTLGLHPRHRVQAVEPDVGAPSQT